MDLKVTFSPPFLPPPSETIPYTVPSHPHIAFYLIKLQWLKFPQRKAHFPFTELFVWYLTKTDVHIFYFCVCRLISFLTVGDPLWEVWCVKGWPGWQAQGGAVACQGLQFKVGCAGGNVLILMLAWYGGMTTTAGKKSEIGCCITRVRNMHPVIMLI